MSPEQAGEIVRHLSDRLVRELGIPPTASGSWTIPGTPVQIEVVHRAGTPVVRLSNSVEWMQIRFIEVRDERQLQMLLSWIRQSIAQRPTDATAPPPGRL